MTTETLLENSLYTSQAERDTLLKDKQKLMSAIIFNFVGFLGLYKLSDKRGYMKTYETTEGKLQIHSIADTNHDVSLVIKLGHDAGIIPPAVAMEITKFLFLIKTKKVKGADIDDAKVLDILTRMRVQSHRPDARVWTSLNQFLSGTIGLPELSKQLFHLARLPEFKDITNEYRELVKKGQYNDFFIKMGATGSAPAAATATAPQAIPHSTTPPATSTTPPGPAISGAPPAAAIPASKAPAVIINAPPVLTGPALFAEVLKAHDKSALDVVLKKNAVTRTNFPYAEFSRWMRDNTQTFGTVKHIKDHSLIKAAKSLTSNHLGSTPSNYVSDVVMYALRGAMVEGSKHLNDPGAFITVMSGVDLPDEVKHYARVLDEPTVKKAFTEIGNNAFNFVSRHGIKGFSDIMEQYTLLVMKIRSGAKGAYHNAAALLREDVATPQTMFMSSPVFTKLTASVYSHLATGWGSVKVKERIAQALGLDQSAITVESTKTIFAITDEQISKLSQDAQTFFRLIKEGDSVIKANGLKINSEVSIVDLSADRETLLLEAFKSAIAAGAHMSQFIKELGRARIPLTSLTDAEFKAIGKLMFELGVSPMNWLTSVEGALYGGFKNAKTVETHAGLEILLAFEKNTDGLAASVMAYALYLSGEDDPVQKALLDLLKKPGSNALRNMPKAIADQNSGGWRRKLLDQTTFENLVDLILDHQDRVILNPIFMEMVVRILGVDDAEKFDLKDPQLINDCYDIRRYDYGNRKYGRHLMAKYPSLRERAYNYFQSIKTTTITPHDLMKGGKYLIQDLNEKDTPDWLLELFKASFNTDNTGWGWTMGDRRFVQDCPWLVKIYDDQIRDRAKTKPGGPEMLPFLAESYTTGEINNLLEGTVDLTKLLKVTQQGSSQLVGLVNFVKTIADEHPDISTASLRRMINVLNKEGETNKAIFEKVSRDAVNENICTIIARFYEANRKSDAEKIFDEMTGETKKYVVDYFTKYSLLRQIDDEMMQAPIRPFIKIEPSRLPVILKYNNIELPGGASVRSVKNIGDMIKTVQDFKGKFSPLAAKKVDRSDQEMYRRSAEFDVYNKYRHGDISVQFMEEFDVDLPIQNGFDNWVTEHPGTQIMDPAFHGTGSIAASFILRYGFSVIKSTDASCVGRMLGDGIYFSNVLDKVSQYVSDGGYTRGVGTEGYIFQMKAALGQQPANYRAAGLGGDGIRSPEWCVFEPNNQLRIYKAYKIKIISKNDMQKIKASFNINESTAVPIHSFKEYLREDLVGSGNVTSYTFIDGTIPVSETERVPFEEFDASKFGDHVTMEPSGLGPVVYIRHPGTESQTFAVRYTTEFMGQPELNDFLNLLTNRG